jgi:hypothetical protein
MTGCEIVNCRVGIHAEGGHIAVADTNIRDTPIAFELEKDATVDLKNVEHTFSDAPPSPSRSRRKRRR